MITSKMTRTKELFETSVTGLDIINLLRTIYPGMQIPDEATVRFVVPGGGDWSGMAVEISTENPVIIEWEITVERKPPVNFDKFEG